MAAQKRLNRDDLVSTALAVADAEGLDAVTIRRVAQRHDVTPMALYRHFSDKDGVLDAMAERMLGEVRMPPADDRPWDEQMHDLLTELLRAVSPHPNATMLLFSRMFASEPGLALTDRVLALLADAGMSVEEAADTACHVLNSLVTMILSEPGRRHGPDPEAHDEAMRAQRALLLTLPPHRYPHLVAAADALTSCASRDIYYRRGVDLIITGMRGTTTTAAARRAG